MNSHYKKIKEDMAKRSIPWTAEEFAEFASRIVAYDKMVHDIEDGHILSDTLAERQLILLGYGKGIEICREVEGWYYG